MANVEVFEKWVKLQGQGHSYMPSVPTLAELFRFLIIDSALRIFSFRSAFRFYAEN
jgi:hypothetical protein